MFGTVGNYFFILTWVNVSHSLRGIWLFESLSQSIHVHIQAPPTPAPCWLVQPKPKFEMWKIVHFIAVNQTKTKNKKRCNMNNSQGGSIYFLFSSSESFVGAESKQENQFHRAMLLLAWYISTNAVRFAVMQYWHVVWCFPCSWPTARQSRPKSGDRKSEKWLLSGKGFIHLKTSTSLVFNLLKDTCRQRIVYFQAL